MNEEIPDKFTFDDLNLETDNLLKELNAEKVRNSKDWSRVYNQEPPKIDKRGLGSIDSGKETGETGEVDFEVSKITLETDAEETSKKITELTRARAALAKHLKSSILKLFPKPKETTLFELEEELETLPAELQEALNILGKYEIEGETMLSDILQVLDQEIENERIIQKSLQPAEPVSPKINPKNTRSDYWKNLGSKGKPE